MRALLIMIVLAIAAPALAQEAGAPDPAQERVQQIRPGRAEIMPPPIEIEHDPEVGRKKPSGYWTGYRPARGGAYRWRMMAVALVVLGLTIFFVVRMLRRASATRATSSSGSSAPRS